MFFVKKSPFMKETFLFAGDSTEKFVMSKLIAALYLFWVVLLARAVWVWEHPFVHE